MNLRLTAIVFLVGAGVVGCGTNSTSGERAQTAISTATEEGALPPGCSPPEVADLLSGLSTAVADRRREKALSYLSTGPGFVVITIYHGKSPGAGRVDSRTPDAAYKNLVDTFGAVKAPKRRVMHASSSRRTPTADSSRSRGGLR